jgi:hypothetical protein
MMTRSLPAVLATLLGVALTGCGGPYSSPEATFETYRDAVAKKDWKSAMTALTPESNDKVVGGLMAVTALASIFNPDAAAVLQKHGLDTKEMLGKLAAAALTNPAGGQDAVAQNTRQYLDSIADKPAFVGDVVAWLEANNKEAENKLAQAATAELSNVQVTGDTATGQLSVPIGGSGTSIRFRKVDGRWLIEL